MMKFHYLLLTFLFGFTSLFAATGTKEDPYELVSGDNPIDFGLQLIESCSCFY